VPAAGRVVLIQRNGNMANDCTDQVHPEVAHAAVLAARVVGLDIAGIDLVAQDISQAAAPQRGAIVEVNAGPGLLMHLKPAVGSPRPVGRAICDHLFPNDAPGPHSRVGVAGSQRHRRARAPGGLAAQPGRAPHRPGLPRRPVPGTPPRRRARQRQLGRRPPPAGEPRRAGRGDRERRRDHPARRPAYDRCEVGIVTDLEGAEALADYDITESDQMVKVLRTQVDVVLPEGTAVLNAATRAWPAWRRCATAPSSCMRRPAGRRPHRAPGRRRQGRAGAARPRGAGQRQQRIVPARPGPLTVWRATHAA
jgi:cyanophycin synthetase